ncbi:MAG: DegV family protein [Clostridia bacterium]|nr:DegV family protein [Clostridia bacterium]
MKRKIISVESTCDLPAEVIEKYGMEMINMEYSVDGEVHRMGDGAYSMHAFYEKMRAGSVTKTSQVNLYEAKEYLSRISEGDAEVIHLAFSSSLSGTCNNFIKAAEEIRAENPERKIAVVDSLCACAGQGFYAVAVAEYFREHDFTETVEYAEWLKHKVIHFFVVDNLKYLARGGRISKATALLGNAIHMKPVMHMDKAGKLVPYKKVLSRKKSVMEIGHLAADKYDGTIKRIFIAHADCPEEAEFLAERVERETGIKPEIFDLGMVIGSHSGPGTLSIYLTGKARE